MSICTIYTSLSESDTKIPVGFIQKHYEMNTWLLTNGKKKQTYEIQRGVKVHSIWIWKEKTERWGRTATPSKKEAGEPNESEKVEPKSSKNDRKASRHANAKNNKNSRLSRS